MTDRRKITAALPARLSAASSDVSCKCLMEALRHTLETPAHSDWSRRLLALEGLAPLDLDLDELRRDGA